MVAGLVPRVLLSCLAGHVFDTLALPNPPRPTSQRAHVPLLHEAAEETAESTPLQARMDGAASAIMAADIPTKPQQSQDITSTEGRNETGVIPNLSITYEGVNCSDLSTGRDNKCWEELQLTTWVQNWIVGNTCYENEPFASCFLRKVGYPELDCTGIKQATCTPPPIKEGMDSRVFYVAYNFYAINQYFGSWYTAVGAAATLAGFNIDSIVQLINPPDNTNLILSSVLIALTGIFAVAPGLGLNIGNLLDKLVSSAATTAQNLRTGLVFVENAIIGFPQIGRWLYPIGDTQSQLIQLADLRARLGDLIANVQANLNATVASVMADPTSFLAFASQGNFTAACPSLPDQQTYLLYGFNTYVISAALAGNDIHAAVALDTNVQALVTNGSQDHLAYDLSACEGYDAYNVCDAFWYSGALDATFSLNHFAHPGRALGSLLVALFEQYTTGQLLFDNAFACARDRNNNSTGASTDSSGQQQQQQQQGEDQELTVTVNAAGVNTQCLSRLDVLVWDMSCTGVGDLQCEFLDREEEGPQNGWLRSCGSGSYFSVMDEPVYCVPNGYLGPLVRQRRYKLDRGG
ncbi:MAG: hypothetical protein Q9207_008243 [Kuettlingeria erythrocarpa]